MCTSVFCVQDKLQKPAPLEKGSTRDNMFLFAVDPDTNASQNEFSNKQLSLHKKVIFFKNEEIKILIF
jgi:hypothetical protein